MAWQVRAMWRRFLGSGSSRIYFGLLAGAFQARDEGRKSAEILKREILNLREGVKIETGSLKPEGRDET